MRVLILDQDKMLESLTKVFKAAHGVVETDPDPVQGSTYSSEKIETLLKGINPALIVVPRRAFERFSEAVAEINEAMVLPHNISVISSNEYKDEEPDLFLEGAFDTVARDQGHTPSPDGHLDKHPPTITIDGVKLNYMNNEVTVNGTPIELNKGQYKFLRMTMLRAGSRCSTNNLLNNLYPSDKESSKNNILDVYKSQINKKIHTFGGPKKFIENFYKRGYAVRSNQIISESIQTFGALTKHRDGCFSIITHDKKTEILDLTPASETLLSALIEAANNNDTTITSKQTLLTALDKLTGKKHNNNHLNVFLHSLREKIAEETGLDIIENVRGEGYRLRKEPVAYVKQPRGRSANPAAAAAEVPASPSAP